MAKLGLIKVLLSLKDSLPGGTPLIERSGQIRWVLFMSNEIAFDFLKEFGMLIEPEDEAWGDLDDLIPSGPRFLSLCYNLVINAESACHKEMTRKVEALGPEDGTPTPRKPINKGMAAPGLEDVANKFGIPISGASIAPSAGRDILPGDVDALDRLVDSTIH